MTPNYRYRGTLLSNRRSKTRVPNSTGMRMATRGWICSTRSLVAMRCILGAAGSLCRALSATLRCPHRSQTMPEYLFSRLTPRADLGFSQIEKFARLDPYGQHQAIWQLFDIPAFYALSCSAPQDRTGLWNIQSKPYAPRLAAGDWLHFKLRVNPVVTRN